MTRRHVDRRSRTRPSRRRRRAGAAGQRDLNARRRRLGTWMLALGVLIAGALVLSALLDRGTATAPAPPSDALRHPDPATLTPVEVLHTVDGDTLEVRSAGLDLTVRLFGVDTPERGEPCHDQARDRLEELAGGQVRLRADERQRDRFGRELRYVYTVEGFSLDATLVVEGLARAWTADGALRDELVSLEEEARAAGSGCLWS